MFRKVVVPKVLADFLSRCATVCDPGCCSFGAYDLRQRTFASFVSSDDIEKLTFCLRSAEKLIEQVEEMDSGRVGFLGMAEEKEDVIEFLNEFIRALRQYNLELA